MDRVQQIVRYASEFCERYGNVSEIHSDAFVGTVSRISGVCARRLRSVYERAEEMYELRPVSGMVKGGWARACVLADAHTRHRVSTFSDVVKARPVKHIRKIPTGNPKRPWRYVYPDEKKSSHPLSEKAEETHTRQLKLLDLFDDNRPFESSDRLETQLDLFDVDHPFVAPDKPEKPETKPYTSGAVSSAGDGAKILSLFSGIGGLDLGLSRALPAAKHTAMVEVAKFPQRVLAKQFPNVPIHGDVKDIARAAKKGELAERPNIVVGGFPCKDISSAGTGAGIEGKRSGLYKEMAVIVRETDPDWVIYENTPLLRSRGLEKLLEDQHGFGYEVAWDGVTAFSVGASHIRDRIFVVAHRPGVEFEFKTPDPSDYENPWSQKVPPIANQGTHIKERTPKIMGAGHAVVPAVGQHIGNMISQSKPGARDLSSAEIVAELVDGTFVDDKGKPVTKWPRAGVMRDGKVYKVPSAVPKSRPSVRDLEIGQQVWVRNPNSRKPDPSDTMSFDMALTLDHLKQGKPISRLSVEQQALLPDLMDQNIIRWPDDGGSTPELTFWGESLLEQHGWRSYRGQGGAMDEYPGRVVHIGGDQVDVELPNGEIEPMDVEYLALYPTPTANDYRGGRKPGTSSSTYDPEMDWRKKGAQVRHWVDGAVNHEFTTHLMGFPSDWMDGVSVQKSFTGLVFDALEKARPVKYIRRVPTGNPKRPWRYIYPDDPEAQANKQWSSGVGVETYVSPRQVSRDLTAKEKLVRDTAYALKAEDPEAIDRAVRAMKPKVPSGSVLVPMPSSLGDVRDTLPLAQKLAEATGSTVDASLVRAGRVESTRARRMRGGGQPAPAEHNMRWTGGDLSGKNVVFVDNVMLSGSTFQAARDVIGTGRGLAYAKAEPFESEVRPEKTPEKQPDEHGQFDLFRSLLLKSLLKHKYIRKIPTGNPKRPWRYIYPDEKKSKRPAKHPLDESPPVVGPVKYTMGLVETEEAIRNQPLEHLVVFDSTNDQQVYRDQGTTSSVEFTKHDAKTWRNHGDCIATHNHPSSSPLSPSDLMVAIGADLQEIRAVLPTGGVSVFTRPDQGWGTADGINATEVQTLIQTALDVATRRAAVRMNAVIEQAGGNPKDGQEATGYNHRQWLDFFGEEWTNSANNAFKSRGLEWKIENIRPAGSDGTRQRLASRFSGRHYIRNNTHLDAISASGEHVSVDMSVVSLDDLLKIRDTGVDVIARNGNLDTYAKLSEHFGERLSVEMPIDSPPEAMSRIMDNGSAVVIQLPESTSDIAVEALSDTSDKLGVSSSQTPLLVPSVTAESGIAKDVAFWHSPMRIHIRASKNRRALADTLEALRANTDSIVVTVDSDVSIREGQQRSQLLKSRPQSDMSVSDALSRPDEAFDAEERTWIAHEASVPESDPLFDAWERSPREIDQFSRSPYYGRLLKSLYDASLARYGMYRPGSSSLSDVMRKAKASPPPGYQPVPGSKAGGYRKFVGGAQKFDYWYPPKTSVRQLSINEIVSGASAGTEEAKQADDAFDIFDTLWNDSDDPPAQAVGDREYRHTIAVNPEIPWTDPDWTPDLNSYDYILINSSAGKDSQAMLTRMVELAERVNYPKERLIVVHADLGRVEWDGTVELAKRQADHYNLRFEKVSRDEDLLSQVETRFITLSKNAKGLAEVVAGSKLTNPTWEQLLELGQSTIQSFVTDSGTKKKLWDIIRAKGSPTKKDPNRHKRVAELSTIPWPSSSARYCTSDHKTSQVSKFVTRLHEEFGRDRPLKILNTLGIRAQESSVRSKKKGFAPKSAYQTKGTKTKGQRSVDEWFPIFGWPEERVWDVIHDSKLEYHRAYDLGMSRLSCAFCVFAPQHALVTAARHNPKLFEQYLAVERKVGHAFQHEKPLSTVARALALSQEREMPAELVELGATRLGQRMIKALTDESVSSFIRAMAIGAVSLEQNGTPAIAIDYDWKADGACVHLNTGPESHHVTFLSGNSAFSGSFVALCVAKALNIPLIEHGTPAPTQTSSTDFGDMLKSHGIGR